jgi:hypothetical protein
MNITELRTRVQSEATKFGPTALNDRTQLVMKSEPGRGGNPAVERLHTVKQNGEPRAEIDPLMQALLDRLPQPNAIWSIEDRGKWLKAAAMAFNLIYKTE